jgi:hypothetical protein
MNREFISQFVEIKSPWLTLIGEKIRDSQGKILEYWRVEKDDSLIIIIQHKNQLIFPPLVFREGIKKVTLDFAGGRVNSSETLENNALRILKQELNILPENIKYLIPLNREGWIINSSFSNQLLWGFYGLIDDDVSLDRDFIGDTYNLTQEDLANLLNNLTCLQCRSILLETICQKIITIS